MCYSLADVCVCPVCVLPAERCCQLQQDHDMQYWGVNIHDVCRRCGELGIQHHRRPVSHRARYCNPITNLMNRTNSLTEKWIAPNRSCNNKLLTYYE